MSSGDSRVEPNTVKDIVEATTVLHNLLRFRHSDITPQEADHEDENNNVTPGAWRGQCDWPNADQQNAPPNSATADRKHHRELLKAYFNSPQGAFGYQENSY